MNTARNVATFLLNPLDHLRARKDKESNSTSNPLDYPDFRPKGTRNYLVRHKTDETSGGYRRYRRRESFDCCISCYKQDTLSSFWKCLFLFVDPSSASRRIMFKYHFEVQTFMM